MSAHIGTNFSLQSSEFLDSRQGQALSKADLLNWKTPVPEGFEVYLDNEWYFYDPKANLPDTGHWIPRVYKGEGSLLENQTVSAKYIRALQNKVDDLEQIVRSLSIKFNLVHVRPAFENALKDEESQLRESFTIGIIISSAINQTTEVAEDLFKFSDINRDGRLDSKDEQELMGRVDRFSFISKDPTYYKGAIIDQGIYEVGTQVLPLFKPSLEQDGELIDPIKVERYHVNSIKDISFYMDPSHMVHSNGLITSTSPDTIRIPIKAYLKTGQVVYDEIKYKFLHNIFWGVAVRNEIISESKELDYLKLEELNFSSRLSENFDIDTTINVSPGKTPILLVPNIHMYSSIIPKIFINDTLMNPWRESIEIRNSKGLDVSYSAYGIRNFTVNNPTVRLKVITENRNG